ncbi:MAG TPA: TonB-dependent receptor, partial [Novosphingobium sp.]|nr:TonB-dependent receptor [Novosphingobium sp.]
MAKQTDWRGSVSVAVLGMAAAMATSGQAYAQGQPHQEAADNQGLQEIVVTAQFKKQNVQDAPLAITAVNAAMIEARNQTGVASLAQRAPGVQFSAGGEGGGAQTAAVTIRGIGQNDFQFPNDPGVGIYIDDVYYGISFASSFDLVDLDRVEILRGPQGTLSGKNSIGGSIKLYSQLPSAEPNAYIEGTYGSFNRVQIKAASNFTLVPDQLYARFTGMSRHVDGYMTRLDYGCVHGTTTPGGSFATPSSGCVIGTEGGQDMFALRGALRWLPAPGIEDNLIVDYAQDNSEPSPEKLLILNGGENYITGPRSYTNYATYTGNVGTSTQYTDPAKSTTRSWGISNNLNVELGHGLALRSITAYRFAAGGSAWDGDAAPITSSQEYVTFRHRQFTQELRLSGQVGKWADVTVGAYLYDAHSGDGGRIDIAVAGLDFADDDIFRQTSKSAFAHVVVHPLAGFNITAGLRYTSE